MREREEGVDARRSYPQHRKYSHSHCGGYYGCKEESRQEGGEENDEEEDREEKEVVRVFLILGFPSADFTGSRPKASRRKPKQSIKGKAALHRAAFLLLVASCFWG
ncbi:hypothetical protein [Candidatus Raskinella chloraquaticus]|uniref:hypothetical protein n=1 Tax=Candidatus Raskinella chloraquaticus TaxID=1951219 RepID=UPI00366B7526